MKRNGMNELVREKNKYMDSNQFQDLKFLLQLYKRKN